MKTSAALLVGGESRRMGRDKATILIRGKPLWEIQLNLLRKLQPAELFLSGRTDPVWRSTDVRFVADDPPSRGPLSGIASLLARIQATHLLVLAVDMPFMRENYLRSLCDRIEPGRGVLPMIDGRAEPLAAIYPAKALVDLVEALSGNDFSLQSVTKILIGSGKLRKVPVQKDQEEFFRNLNEPPDLLSGANGVSRSDQAWV